MRQLGVCIRNDFLKPVPVFTRGVAVALHQPRGERFADLVRAPVAAEPTQIFVNADERERPGARRRKLGGHRQRLLEELRREHLKTALAGLRHAQPQCPQRMALAIFRADILQPAPVEAHEVAEAAELAVEGVVQERRVGGGVRAKLRRAVPQLLQHQRQHQRAGVVVRAIAFGKIWHGEARVLEDARRIAHAKQMIQLQLRQLAGLFVERLDG